MKFRLLTAVLSLFDGEGGAASGDGTASVAAAQTEAEGNASASVPEAGGTDSQVEDKGKAFKSLIEGEYKDEYTKATQDIINRRFKETKNLQKQVDDFKPVMDMLMERYGVSDLSGIQQALENDNGYWEQAAYDAGFNDVDQFKQFKQLERQNRALQAAEQQRLEVERANAQMAQWDQEARAFAAKNPNFNLEQECKNPQFLDMLGRGLPVEYAYNALHYDDDINAAISDTAKSVEKKTVDNIRARGMRPSENGMSSTKAIETSKNISGLSAREMQDMVRKARSGEIITFR